MPGFYMDAELMSSWLHRHNSGDNMHKSRAHSNQTKSQHIMRKWVRNPSPTKEFLATNGCWEWERQSLTGLGLLVGCFISSGWIHIEGPVGTHIGHIVYIVQYTELGEGVEGRSGSGKGSKYHQIIWKSQNLNWRLSEAIIPAFLACCFVSYAA